MRIAVMGAGGIGSYLGARLQQAGADVAFIARGAGLAALRSGGLTVREHGGGGLGLDTVTASDDPAAVGAVDIVLFCVKLYDTDAAAALCRPLMGPGTWVLSLQNGVESVERLEAVLGAGRALGGACNFSATLLEPGVVLHNGRVCRFDFGDAADPACARAADFVRLCTAAGVEAHVHADIRRVLWEKFVLVIGSSGAAVLTRQPIGPIHADPVMDLVYQRALAEAGAVGRALGVALPPGLEERLHASLKERPATLKPSLLVDLERGNRLEAEWFFGTLCRLARETGIATPVTDTIYAAMRPFLDGAPR